MWLQAAHHVWLSQRLEPGNIWHHSLETVWNVLTSSGNNWQLIIVHTYWLTVATQTDNWTRPLKLDVTVTSLNPSPGCLQQWWCDAMPSLTHRLPNNNMFRPVQCPWDFPILGLTYCYLPARVSPASDSTDEPGWRQPNLGEDLTSNSTARRFSPGWRGNLLTAK